MQNRRGSIPKAIKALWEALKSERHLQYHVLVAIGTVGLGFVFRLGRMEWLLVLIMIGLVLSAEVLNTVLEEVLDIIHPERDEKIGYLKDLMSGFVFVLSITALIIGLIIFLPYFLNLG